MNCSADSSALQMEMNKDVSMLKAFSKASFERLSKKVFCVFFAIFSDFIFTILFNKTFLSWIYVHRTGYSLLRSVLLMSTRFMRRESVFDGSLFHFSRAGQATLWPNKWQRKTCRNKLFSNLLTKQRRSLTATDKEENGIMLLLLIR